MTRDNDQNELGRINAQLYANTFDDDHATTAALLDGAVAASAHDLTTTADEPVTDSYRWAALVKCLSDMPTASLTTLLAEAVFRLARLKVQQDGGESS
ncbi:hypothetical protein [Mycobacteroides abscessus]|uniref:hypothetical protein n=1 Tax=Mycobacteroides abscessus TaxID=36809 RepID=UPI00092CAFA8|nr:hypothetical protein [Mycobacteroides abscessus]SKS27847.1 Uncharacterised protein [Mycobacteroides abscessus subsp. abscessus]SHU55028.1 Uncharacterised protein [Mycobacteroides abscessus subsp. bolletii]SHW63603.1 Uncharacterised protein [Mycobacteroides abscessus subsp. bolletii]SHW91657.1 Uncharacterised protein [Mycobacteroides abscessus subsp. bolletii]SHX33415.1 Uncharacterised protein [Mycobacteroides abscessus subsp. bolletii]